MKSKTQSEIVGIELHLSTVEAHDFWYWYNNRNIPMERADDPDKWRRGINMAGKMSESIRDAWDLK